MRYSGTWLRPEDEAILESLQDDGPAGPGGLDERGCTPFSRAYIERRCARLAGQGGLVSFDRGVYRLTAKGSAYLAGDLEPADLE